LAKLVVASDVRWLAPALTHVAGLIIWRGQMPRVARGLHGPWRSPHVRRVSARMPWGMAKPVPWIVRPPVDPIPPDPAPDFPTGDVVGLNLGCPVIGIAGLAPLNLGVTACYAVRPQQRTYIVLNTITVVRLPDRTPIEVDAVGITGDVASWGFSFDATLSDPNQLDLLKPTAAGPRQIEVTLNGYVWTFFVESYSNNREFASTTVNVTGRSRTALLAAPYAPARSREVTSQRSMAQLAGDELADTGFTLSYDTVDWIVPAGAWYYDGMAAMDALVRLAEASGAVVQSDPQNMSLRIRPRYPASPWAWSVTVPDVTVQDDLMLNASLQVRSVPKYDAVVVTGEITGKGVTAVVKRAGEGGTLFAQQVSDQLISTAATAQERGRNILSDRGEQASIDQVLPLFPVSAGAGTTGRVLPLDLVEVHEAGQTWQGLCTAINIAARRDDRAVVIEQTITLERHYTDAN
jgi:hypothetical protein